MFDLWIRDTDISTWIIAFDIFILLPGQLLLCFKARKRLVKLLPLLVFAALTVVFLALMRTATDWSALGYVILAVLSCEQLLFCALGWGIWALIRYRQKKKRRRSAHS